MRNLRAEEWSACLQNPLHGKSELRPTGGLAVQTAATCGRQCVDSGAAVVLRRSHLGFDVAAQLEPMERRVQRALACIQPVARNLPDTVGDAPPVIGTECKDLQNQQVERALKKVGF